MRAWRGVVATISPAISRPVYPAPVHDPSRGDLLKRRGGALHHGGTVLHVLVRHPAADLGRGATNIVTSLLSKRCSMPISPTAGTSGTSGCSPTSLPRRAWIRRGRRLSCRATG